MFDSQFRLCLICGALGMLSACFSPTLQTPRPQTAVSATPVARTIPSARPSGTASAIVKASTDIRLSPPLSAGVDVPQPTPTPAASVSAPLVSASSFSGGGGGGSNAAPTSTIHPLLLDDIQLETGESVLFTGSEAPGIQADLSGKTIDLFVKGSFGNASSQNTVATIDNAISLAIVNTSNNVLHLRLNTQNVPDLYLIGPHKFELTIDNQSVSSRLNILAPEQSISLAPSITNVSEEKYQIIIRGKHLMLNPFFSEVKINTEKVNIMSTDIQNGLTELHVLKPSNYIDSQVNSIIYTSPFGVHFYTTEEN